jgi:hypothetical protein
VLSRALSEPSVAVVEPEAVGSADERDGLGEVLDLDAEGDVEGEGLVLTDGDVGADAVSAELDSLDGDTDAALVDASGTAARTPSGAASPRDGVS